MPFKIEAKGDYIIAQVAALDAPGKFTKVESAPKQQYMEVIAAGEDVDRCEVGDKILPFGQEFQAFSFEGQQYLIVRNDQVLGVINV